MIPPLARHEIIRRVGPRDPAAGGGVILARNSDSADRFERAVAPVRPELAAYARHLLWRKDDLPDALQSILLTAYRRFPEFETGSNFRAWIFRIATYEVFNRNRRTDRDRRRMMPLDEQDAPAAELEAEIHYDELLRRPEVLECALDAELVAALRRLGASELVVLLLRVLGGFSTLETARMLDMPAGSVMGFLGRARRKLRLALAGYARTRGWLAGDRKVNRT